MIRKHITLCSLPLFLTVVVGFAGDSDETAIWPEFPLPESVVSQPRPESIEERIVQQTLAGVVARAAREGEGDGSYLWIEPMASHADYGLNFATWRERTGVPVTRAEGDVWSLVEHYRELGVVYGYVLYREDRSGTPAHESIPPEDQSLNVATSLGGPLRAIAVDESIEDKARSAGLDRLLDVRERGYDWLLENYGDRLNRRILGLLDSRMEYARDIAVASDALVVLNAPGGGFEEGLDFVERGSMLFGWGLTPEDLFVEPASAAGMQIVAANWSFNIPILSSGRSEALVSRPEQDRETPRFDPEKRYVAFILSDGDNLTWLMGDYQSRPEYFGHPDRGNIPFGWTLPLRYVELTNPDIWTNLVRSAGPNDDLINFGVGGYTYADHKAPDLLRRQAELLAPVLPRQGHLSTMQFSHNQWDSPRSIEGYEAILAGAPELRGIWAIQYAPYAAGQGAVLWVDGPRGETPVLSARASIWKGMADEYAGSYEHVAGLLNAWAGRPAEKTEDHFSWVIIHAWSDFGDGKMGFGAAQACAALLDGNIEVVLPSVLLDMLHEEAGTGR